MKVAHIAHIQTIISVALHLRRGIGATLSKMFLIVPKRPKNTAARLEANVDAAPSNEGSRVPRAVTACDSCRIKKTKVAAS